MFSSRPIKHVIFVLSKIDRPVGTRADGITAPDKITSEA